MSAAIIESTGLWTPPDAISNEELVASYNAWVDLWNGEHAGEIEAGEAEAKQPSSVEFIEKASGIKSRFVISKDAVLDPEIMAPRIPERGNDEISVLADMAVKAAQDALQRAGKTAADVDAVICACSNLQRPYPAIAVEVQDALGIEGWGFDMNVACSSATFGLQAASDMISGGHARAILVVNPEICSGHLNFRDRDSHFIFGDVATAILVTREDLAKDGWRVIGTHLKTKFSNNIRNNFGFLNRAAPDGVAAEDKLFIQQGRKVFKEVVPLVSAMILDQLEDLGLTPADLKRMWLHQANLNMNRMIAHKVLGKEMDETYAPVVLDRYANTSSAGSIIAFHLHSGDFEAGEKGLICSFGAGYSAGTVFVEKR